MRHLLCHHCYTELERRQFFETLSTIQNSFEKVFGELFFLKTEKNYLKKILDRPMFQVSFKAKSLFWFIFQFSDINIKTFDILKSTRI